LLIELSNKWSDCNVDNTYIDYYNVYQQYIISWAVTMASTKKKPIQIYLREDQVNALRIIAERRDESIAALVRAGVDRLLDDLPSEEDPLLDIVGLYDSGRGDLAEKHDEYLVQTIHEESDREA
jgi:hypothetical protein